MSVWEGVARVNASVSGFVCSKVQFTELGNIKGEEGGLRGELIHSLGTF